MDDDASGVHCESYPEGPLQQVSIDYLSEEISLSEDEGVLSPEEAIQLLLFPHCHQVLQA